MLRTTHNAALAVLVVLVALVASPLALGGCAQAKDPASWQNTTRAAAAAALDFAQCSQDGLTKLADQGPAVFSLKTTISVAETCGIADVADGFAILVAIYRDVVAMWKKSHPSAAPAPDEQTPKGTP